ncbi:hypothetical protein LOC68_00440 [Blastopirellula sp. JC732]|uniref:Uncharacterized protein n=1 Tax=Blastopirellula sediminis TaxID=2894196 RepID=A0A9X1SES7_9BACT|nr:hypothetical protein [Blastopirellula sediminis]MCC9626861.1 hypothetical protein [Blastopirellula sediminis]
MIESNDNPFASPQATSTMADRSNVPAFEWYSFPTQSGLFYGGILGAAALGILGVMVVILENADPLPLFVLPVFVAIGAICGAMLGGISGAAIGLVAVFARKSLWKTEVHFFSSMIVSPFVFAGPWLLLGYQSGMLSTERYQIFVGVMSVCGLLHGVCLFLALRSISKAKAEQLRSSSWEHERD